MKRERAGDLEDLEATGAVPTILDNIYEIEKVRHRRGEQKGRARSR